MVKLQLLKKSVIQSLITEIQIRTIPFILLLNSTLEVEQMVLVLSLLTLINQMITVFVKALYDPTGIVYSAFGSTTFDTIKYSNPYSDVNYFYVSTSCVKEWLDATGKHMKDTVWNQFDTTFLVGTASVKEQIKVQLILYPNPTSQYLNLPKISEAKELSIYNTIGQVVLHQESNISQSLDVSNFTKGFYFLTLYDKDRNRIGQGRFYKE